MTAQERRAMALAEVRARISEATGFDQGDEFASEEEVREYFTVSEIQAMFGRCEFTQAHLDAMAEAVIEHRWHMVPQCENCARCGLVSSATEEVDGEPQCAQCAEEHRAAVAAGVLPAERLLPGER